MSGLAHIAIANGHKVFGSDLQECELTEELRRKGAVIYDKHCSSNITDNIDLVVYTSAIKEDNPEYIEAKKKNIRLENRAVFLGNIMKNYKNPISVSGTHGKTTTTSMLSAIFKYGEYDPTILVGGNLNIIKGNVCVGNSEYFITEACEYTNSFLNFNSKVGIVLNIEADHLDFFKDLDDIKNSFNAFGKLLPEDGFFVINGDDNNTKNIDSEVIATTVRFGKSNENDAVFEILGYDERGCAEFKLKYKDRDLGIFKISVPGEHNVYNAVASIMSAYLSGLDIDNVRKNIQLYTGVGRRFEYKGKIKDNIIVIDDYAHHPTEIRATLKAVRNIAKSRVWAIFQPHTYSRTLSLLDDFSKSFDDADIIIIPDIYASREKFTDEVSSNDLYEKLKNNYPEKIVSYFPNMYNIIPYVEKNTKENDIVLTIGAGDIYKIGEELIK